jgi:hypothetical protein
MSRTDVLLDWRFNLIVIGCMETLLIIFALPREIEHYRTSEAQNALWQGNYPRAFYYYSVLRRKDPSNKGYLKGLGDAAFGRAQYQAALEYYSLATDGTFNTPDVQIQAAKACNELARPETDAKQRALYLENSQKLLQRARQEGAFDLKVCYELGQIAVQYGDLTEAAEYFSRVRANGIRPNPEQAAMIAKAKAALAQIQSIIFKNADYRLDLAGVEIHSTPTLPVAPPPPPTIPTMPPVATTSSMAVAPKPAAPTSAGLPAAPKPSGVETSGPKVTRTPVEMPPPAPTTAPAPTIKPAVSTPAPAAPRPAATPLPPPAGASKVTTAPKMPQTPAKATSPTVAPPPAKP